MLPRYKDIVELLKKGSTIEAQEQILRLREGAMELQEENLALRERIRDLEAKLESIDDWSKEKARYVLVTPWMGPSQVYALRESRAEGEAPHYLCTNCFQNSKKVILNPTKRESWVIMVCPSCKGSLETGYKGIGRASYGETFANED